MIVGHEKFNIPNEEKKRFTMEVNWNKDKRIKDCKVLRVVFPDGQMVHIRKDHLTAVLFAIGNEEEQRKMVPTTVERVRWYETVVSVKAKRAIAKGENITFPIKLTLPAEKYER